MTRPILYGELLQEVQIAVSRRMEMRYNRFIAYYLPRGWCPS